MVYNKCFVDRVIFNVNKFGYELTYNIKYKIYLNKKTYKLKGL